MLVRRRKGEAVLSIYFPCDPGDIDDLDRQLSHVLAGHPAVGELIGSGYYFGDPGERDVQFVFIGSPVDLETVRMAIQTAIPAAQVEVLEE